MLFLVSGFLLPSVFARSDVTSLMSAFVDQMVDEKGNTWEVGASLGSLEEP